MVEGGNESEQIRSTDAERQEGDTGKVGAHVETADDGLDNRTEVMIGRRNQQIEKNDIPEEYSGVGQGLEPGLLVLWNGTLKQVSTLMTTLKNTIQVVDQSSDICAAHLVALVLLLVPTDRLQLRRAHTWIISAQVEFVDSWRRRLKSLC